MVRLFLTIFLSATLMAREPVRGRRAMVTAQEPIATDVGLEILKQGGNAVDAAIAVGFALAVTHPYAGQPRGRRIHAGTPSRWPHELHRFP